MPRRSVTDFRLSAVLVLLSAMNLRCGSSDGSPSADGGTSGAASTNGGASNTGGGQSASGGSVASSGGTSPNGNGGSGNGSSGGSSNYGSGGSSSGGTTPNTNGGAGNGGSANGGAGNGGSASGGAGNGGSASGGSANGGAGNGGSANGGAPSGWTLTWSDEFNGAKGTAVDTSKWNMINKGDGFGNNELEFYTNRTDNAAMDGSGDLVITAKKESYMGRDYTSARLESSGKFEHLFGRFESRLKVPKGQGLWPAFWILGNNIGSAGWPTCGEIDIMENIGKEPTQVHGSMHGPGYSGGNPLTGGYTLPNGGKFADDFHVFAIEWEMNVVRFYVDDHLYETRTPSDVPSGAKWVYDHPFYIILNVAVGGQWPGNPDGTTTFPQTMTVDYVRVYSR
jgi:hypothetical protein